jgi:hypothetical protein
MKFILTLILTFSAQFTLADTIVVPSKEVTLDVFLGRCHKTGYICSHDYMSEKLILTATPKFNQLIENLDLLDENQRKILHKEILNILKNELISLEQLGALTQIAEKALSIEKTPQLVFLFKELSDVHLTMTNQTEKENEAVIYIVFKKRLAAVQFEKIKYKIQNYKYYKVDPFQIIEKNQPEIVLVSGSCQKKHISPLITSDLNTHQIYPLFENDCSSDFNFHTTVKSATEFSRTHQKTILWSLAAVGAAFFLKNYDVEFK